MNVEFQHAVGNFFQGEGFFVQASYIGVPTVYILNLLKQTYFEYIIIMTLL